MKVFITHSLDLFNIYFYQWLDQMYAKNEICVSNQDGDNIIYAKFLPSVDDILSYINDFISYHQSENNDILTYYFILDKFENIKNSLLNNPSFQFVINLKKFYSIFIDAIKKRIKNQMFYFVNVESLADNNDIRTISANIGKQNVVLFEDIYLPKILA